MLTDFLKPNVKRVKLLSHIHPIKKYIDDQYSNLDLNTTARKQLRKLIVLTSYLDLGSYLVATFDLAEEIGSYIPPEKPKEEEDPRKRKKKVAAKKPPRA